MILKLKNIIIFFKKLNVIFVFFRYIKITFNLFFITFLRFFFANKFLCKNNFTAFNIKLFLIYLGFIFSYSSFCQNISLEDIWINNTFSMANFEDFKWSKSGKTYFKIKNNPKTNKLELAEFDVISDKKLKIKCLISELKINNKSLEIDDFVFSEDESKIIIQTETENIYRRSTKSIFYVFDCQNQKLTALIDSQKVTQISFSADGKKIAFTKENNLFIKNLETNIITQITKDGKKNEIINGTSDWVYEEEFEIVKCFFWNNSSNKIAFLKFDESHVKDYEMQIWGKDLYPHNYIFKYPKAGEKNAFVSVLVYDIEKSELKTVFDGKNKDSYVPRINWTNDQNILSVKHLNRNQDSLVVVHYNTKNDSNSIIMTSKSDTYIDTDDNFLYLNKSNYLLYKSNDEFRNLVLLDLKNLKSETITQNKSNNQGKTENYANWEIQNIIKIDELNKKIYFVSKDNPPFNQHLFSVDFNGKNRLQLTTLAGVNSVNISSDATYFVLSNSTINQGNSYSLHFCKDGKKVKDLENNQSFKNKLEEYKFNAPEFKSFSYLDTTQKSASSDGSYESPKITLNYYLIKPINFDSTKKYPVLVYFYGGPGSQEVINEWQGKNYLWFQYLTKQGFVVACCDNRGTGGRGICFQHCTTRNLGNFEAQDQIEFGKFLQSYSYIDGKNMATFGWSFGGYLSSLCILKGAEVFKAAIAVAPVTSWRFYDTIYTERYLKNPNDNAKGYDENSPLNHASKLKGKYLLVHGTADDNVHFQNSIAMQQAFINTRKHFETYTYPDKSHGIGGAKTRLHLYQKMTNFLIENLR